MDYLNLVYGSLRPLLDQILFSFEAKKWTQLNLEAALLFSIALTHKLRIFPRPSHGLSIAFTQKMRLFLRPTSDHYTSVVCTINEAIIGLKMPLSDKSYAPETLH